MDRAWSRPSSRLRAPHPCSAGLGAAALGAALVAAACAQPPDVPRATEGDCMTLRLWSNGYHTNIAMPADALGAAHPIRRLFPDAGHFLIGWGERDFYMDPEPGLLRGAAAMMGPRPSAVQVIAHHEPVEERIWPARDLAAFGVSRAGAARLADGIAATLALDENGAAQTLGAGRVHGASVFLAARPRFHLFHMCNHWTASRLREAGVPLRASLSFTAPPLLDAVRAAAPSCDAVR